MPQKLEALHDGTPAPPGLQNVLTVSGQNAAAAMTAPSNTGNMWFSFSIGEGVATLNVNYNGVNYPDTPPGEYSFQGLQTPLYLDVTVAGTVKLAWIDC